jgi:hypothetical protein
MVRSSRFCKKSASSASVARFELKAYGWIPTGMEFRGWGVGVVLHTGWLFALFVILLPLTLALSVLLATPLTARINDSSC